MARSRKPAAARTSHIRPAIDRGPVVQASVLCLALVLAPLIAGRFEATSVLAVQALVLCASLFWMYHAMNEGRLTLPPKSAGIGLAVFVAWAVISAFGSASIHATVRELVNIACYALVYAMAVGLASDRRQATAVVGALILSAGIISVIGLNEYAANWRTGNPGWRTFGTFFNPDFLAGSMALALPVLLAWFLAAESIGATAMSGALLFMASATMIVTGSRMGFVAAAAGLACTVILGLVVRLVGKTQLVRMGVMLILVAAMLQVAGTPLKARVVNQQVVESQTHSGGFRKLTWKGTARMIAANPVKGTGLGTYEVAYPRYAITGYTKLTHNSYLQIAAESGVPALIALLVALAASTLVPISTLLRLRKVGAVQQSEGLPSWMPSREMLLCGIIGGCVASMARNFVDSDWYVTGIGVPFWALLGLAVGLGCADQCVRLSVKRSRAGIAAGVLGVMLIGVLMLTQGESALSSGISLASQGDGEGSMDSLRSSLGFDRFNPETHRRIAAVLVSKYRGTGDESALDEAVREYGEASRLEPAGTKTHYQLGRAYDFAGMYAEAEKAYSSAVDRDPKSPQNLLALARCYEKLGRRADALKIYQRMVEVEESPYETVRAVPELIEPTYIFAHAAIGRDLESRGDLPAARTQYKRSLDRIHLYQQNMRAMGRILEMGVGRNTELEQQVDELRTDLEKRMASPVGPSGGRSR